MLRFAIALALTLGLALPVIGNPVAQAAPAQADNIVISIDRPHAGDEMAPGSLGGWAVDFNATSGTGIDMILVYMDGDQTNGHLLGQAQLGGDRPDVAEQFGNPNFRFSGWNFNLAGLNIPAGPHSFTVVAHTPANLTAAASVSPVTIVQPAPSAPVFTTGSQVGGLELSAVLTNVSYLFGQNFYSTLPSFNGYLYPGLTLPNGTVVDGGAWVTDGQLYYRGNVAPIATYIAPIYPTPIINGTYTYNTMLPGGTVVPYGAGYNWWTGYNWGALNTMAPESRLTEQSDVIAFQPYGAGYRLGLQIPPAPGQLVNTPGYYSTPGFVAPPPGQFLSPGAFDPSAAPGTITQVNPGVNTQGPWWTTYNYNFAGTSAMQATLLARVSMNGVPVQGAEVNFQGFRLPPTDQNGMTQATVMFPVQPNGTLQATVTANFQGMSTSIPLVLDYTH